MTVVRLDQAKVTALLQGEEGPVGHVLLRLALKVERRARILAPVDTGRLRNSIHHALQDRDGQLEATVGTNVEYAPYVEFGTRYQPARSFLRRALSEVLGR